MKEGYTFTSKWPGTLSICSVWLDSHFSGQWVHHDCINVDFMSKRRHCQLFVAVVLPQLVTSTKVTHRKIVAYKHTVTEAVDASWSYWALRSGFLQNNVRPVWNRAGIQTHTRHRRMIQVHNCLFLSCSALHALTASKLRIKALYSSVGHTANQLHWASSKKAVKDCCFF